MEINKFLKQPYPFPQQNWKTLTAIGFAISICMLLLQPFGLSQLQIKYKTLFLSGYGLVTLIILLFNILFLVRIFSEYRWTILKQILFNLWIVITLGLANYLYSYIFINSFIFSLSAIFIFQLYTFFIALVPITILILIRQNNLLKINQSSAEIISQKLDHLHQPTNLPSQLKFLSDNGKQAMVVNPSDLAYIESIGNYIYIYECKGGSIEYTMLRSTIAKAESIILNQPTLIKCHRAFIINLNYIEAVNGNAQGYRLKIKNSEHIVFVSRQYTKRLKEAIN